MSGKMSVGPHSLQGVVPGTTSNPIHCCLPAGRWVTQGLGFGTHRLHIENYTQELQNTLFFFFRYTGNAHQDKTYIGS